MNQNLLLILATGFGIAAGSGATYMRLTECGACIDLYGLNGAGVRVQQVNSCGIGHI